MGVGAAGAGAGLMHPQDPCAHEEVRCLLFLFFFLFVCLFEEGSVAKTNEEGDDKAVVVLLCYSAKRRR